MSRKVKYEILEHANRARADEIRDLRRRAEFLMGMLYAREAELAEAERRIADAAALFERWHAWAAVYGEGCEASAKDMIDAIDDDTTNWMAGCRFSTNGDGK